MYFSNDKVSGSFAFTLSNRRKEGVIGSRHIITILNHVMKIRACDLFDKRCEFKSNCGLSHGYSLTPKLMHL